ncbi:MAG: hypothetical protein J6L99_01530, partial [Ruminococcus sp.]|nr:hypothetical protein [Ruminococcus sp.]
TCREKSAKVGKKGVQERGVQRGKPKGEKGEGMPIFVGFNWSLPLFHLGLSPLVMRRVGEWQLSKNKLAT